MSGDQTVMKMMGFSVFGSSVKRDHSDSDLNDTKKQVCAKSDTLSRFVSHLSGMKDTIDRLQSEDGLLWGAVESVDGTEHECLYFRLCRKWCMFRSQCSKTA